jgi:WD40 repeat protein
VKKWEVASGREIFSLSGHGDTIVDIDISKDGKHIVTASWDKTLKVTLLLI